MGELLVIKISDPIRFGESRQFSKPILNAAACLSVTVSVVTDMLNRQ
jgi:hypothetical protein